MSISSADILVTGDWIRISKALSLDNFPLSKARKPLRTEKNILDRLLFLSISSDDHLMISHIATWYNNRVRLLT